MNVTGEDAYCCPYYDFHIVSVICDQLTDHGHVPVHGAAMLLVDADRAALIGGYGPDYDLITPLRLTSQGVRPAGRQSRLVLLDGQEILEQLRGTTNSRQATRQNQPSAVLDSALGAGRIVGTLWLPEGNTGDECSGPRRT